MHPPQITTPIVIRYGRLDGQGWIVVRFPVKDWPLATGAVYRKLWRNEITSAEAVGLTLRINEAVRRHREAGVR